MKTGLVDIPDLFQVLPPPPPAALQWPILDVELAVALCWACAYTGAQGQLNGFFVLIVCDIGFHCRTTSQNLFAQC